MNNKIKIAQIGVSHEHALGKMETLRRMPETFEIAGVTDDSATYAAKFPAAGTAAYAGLKIMTEDEVFRIPGLQAVIVEVPNTKLVPTAIRCMRHNLPMHLDKPGGEDLGLFKKLLIGCMEKNLPLQMGYMFRGNPAFKFCLKIIRENWLGEIFAIDCDMNHSYGGSDYQAYLSKFRGGIMFNLGCHLIDFIVAAMGPPENVVPFLKSSGTASNTVKNNCMSVLEYPGAAVSVRCCSQGDITRRALKIAGTGGWVELCPLERFDGERLTMKMFIREDRPGYRAGMHIVDFGIQSDRYMEQLSEFAGMVRGELSNPYSFKHDYVVQKVLLAASGYIKWRKNDACDDFN